MPTEQPAIQPRDTSSMSGIEAFAIIAGMLATVVGVMIKVRRRARPDLAPQPDADITEIKIGIDARCSPFVKRELARIEAAFPQAGERERHLHEVCALLRQLEPAWTHAGGKDYQFGDHGGEGRAVASRPPPFARILPHVPGERIPLVTILIGANSKLPDLGPTIELTRTSIASALEAASHVAPIELDVRFADRSPGGLVHLPTDEPFTVCASCAAPYAGAAGACPRCGAAG